MAKKRLELGISFLETALTLPVFIGLSLGTLDLVKIWQAKRALVEGARETLRCLRTVDGKCVNAAPGELIPRYEVSLIEGGKTEYFGYKYKYSGTEYSLLKPTYDISNFRALTLDKAYYDKTTYEYWAQKAYYEASGETDAVIMTANYPLINGSVPRDATFKLKNATAYNYGNNQVIDLSKIRGAVDRKTREVNLGSVDITIPLPFPDFKAYDCFRSTSFNSQSATHAANYAKLCTDVPGYKKNRASAVLHIIANANQLSNGESSSQLGAAYT